MNTLFDMLKERYKLVTDAQLAEFLCVSGATICNLRAGKKGLSARLTLLIYDRTGMSVEDIRELAKEK